MPNKRYLQAVLYALNAICRLPYAKFKRSLSNPKDAQLKFLKRHLQELARTEFGAAYGITGKEDYKAFASKVPIQTYTELEPWIQKQLLKTHAKVISPNKIIHVETTSGSTSAQKRIPYTKPLLASFTNLFAIWAYDLLSRSSLSTSLQTGKIFISVSPKPTKAESSEDFLSDHQYLREPLRSLVAKFLISPPAVRDWEDFQRQLAMTLLRNSDVEILSVWSPTYLLTLMQYIESHRRELELAMKQEIPLRRHSRSIDWIQVFPNLQLISCWTSANAKLPALKLQKKFHGIRIQGKGLLATEAPLTVPLTDANGCLPLINDVFLEFEDEHGIVHEIDDLLVYNKYELILTQSAGLTRYRTHDIVQVTGFHDRTPILDFIGRANSTSDLVGEKLSEEFAKAVLSPILRDKRFLLVPRLRVTAAYLLLVDATDDAALRAIECFEHNDGFDSCDFRPLDQTISELSDQALCKSHHYELARKQHQLEQVQTLFISDLSDVYQKFQMQEGIKFGDIKDSHLIADVNKANRFVQYISGSLGKTRLQIQASEVQTDFPVQAAAQRLPIPVGS